MKLHALFAGAALALGLASAASAGVPATPAGQLTIVDVETGNGDLNNVTIGNLGQFWTTPILMTDSTGVVHVVFCDDLTHDVYVGGGQNLIYNTAPVTVDGAGNALGAGVSNRMGHLAELGIWDYDQYKKTGNFAYEDGAIAVQAAIWGLEYNIASAAVTSTDAVIQADITRDMAIAVDGTGNAAGIESLNHATQNQITGGVPEPATWAMMLVGVGLLGVALRFHRKQDARLETLRREVAGAASV